MPRAAGDMQDELLGSGRRLVSKAGSLNAGGGSGSCMVEGRPAPPPPAVAKKKSERLQCLDAVRGLNVMLMVFVDNVGGWFQGWIDHSPWDVVHLADFVMPLFLFMVGVSMAFSMKKYSGPGHFLCTKLETTAGSRTGLDKVFFKSGASTNTDHNWRTFAKANFTPSFKPHPSYRGCDSPPGSLLDWCDHTKSHSERLNLLLGQLTLPEKIGLLSPTPALGNPCNTHTAGAPRLGLSDYMWLEESNTGVSSACLGADHCATTFSGPLGLGASFNRSSWYMKGTVIGNELRAMNNIGWFRDAGGTTTEKLGLTGYGKRANARAPSCMAIIR